MKLATILRPGFIAPAGAAVLASSAILALAYYIYVPMSPDGGWYAYPSYAWAIGADPSENMPGYVVPGPAQDRLIAKFGWENRLNLTVPFMGLWFKAFAPTSGGIAALGVLQWLTIAFLAGLAVWIISRDRLMSGAAALLTVSDSRLIAEAVSDARPDVPVLLVALALLCALLSVMRTRTAVHWVLVLLLSVVLPLVHVTAANAIACLSAFLLLLSFLSWRSGERAPACLAYLMPALIMYAVFLLRSPLLDVVVPTAVPPQIEAAGQHSLVQKLNDIVAAGFGHKLAMEWERWAHQFHIANLAHLLALLAGLAFIIGANITLLESKTGATAICLFGGFFCGVLAMFALDPHHTPGHAMVLAVIGYCASCMAVSEARSRGAISAQFVTNLVLVLFAAVFVLKLAHTGLVGWRYEREGISTAELRRQLDAALPRDGAVRIEGASEIWPYIVDRRQPIEITDPDRYTLSARPDALPGNGAGLLIVTDDHYKAGWQKPIADWQTAGRIAIVSRMGECGRTARCFEIYRVTRP